MIGFLPGFPSRKCRIQRECAHPVRCCISSPREAEPHFFAAIRAAAPSILADRGLEIAGMEWSDQCLRVFVSTRADLDGQTDSAGATSDHCQYASIALAGLLDEDSSLMPFEEYALEVSSPGTRNALTKDREYEAFKGFEVRVTTTELFKKKSCFEGTLLDRTEDHLKINLKGRILRIPRAIVDCVELQPAKEESVP